MLGVSITLATLMVLFWYFLSHPGKLEMNLTELDLAFPVAPDP